ncbi:hypothetical protein ACHAPJ_011983 [Fusarium lateritium]
MHFSTFIFASSLSLSASAFTVFDKDRAKDYYGDDACYKAVTADLKCNEMVRDLDETGWQGSLEDDEDNAITDKVIDEFPDVDDDEGEDWPLTYLCEPCYVRRLWMFDLSEYSPAQGHFLDQWERVLKGCPETVKAEISKVAVNAEASETAKPEPWEVAHTGSGDRTTSISSSESIATPTTTTSAESTTAATTERNGAEKLGQGYTFGGWSLMFILGINIF